MKKIIILLSLLIASNTFAQDKVESFEVTPNGINGFVVKEFPDKSSEELFEDVKKWAEYEIGSAKKSNQSEVENEYLKYDVIFGDGISAKSGPLTLYWDLMLTVEFRFKPSKVRIDVKIDRMESRKPQQENMEFIGGMMAWSLYNKSGDPRNITKEPREQINQKTNSIVTGVENYILGKDKNVSKDW